MAISIKTLKMLWGRAASRCSFPECKAELVMDSTLTDNESIIGEACHIISKTKSGPRGENDLAEEKRDKYNNLILLCNIHHKLIDDQPNEYSVKRLNEIKTRHEEWVKSKLQEYDKEKQTDDEIYASYIEEFEYFIDINNWNNWTSELLSHGQPRIFKYNFEKLIKLQEWLLTRIWSNRYIEIEDSFENIRIVLQDFTNTFKTHLENFGNDMLITRKFYQISDWNPELYEKLGNQYDAHVDLVEDLALELTRAVNFCFDKIRKCLMSNYRLKEGVLVITAGPLEGLKYRTFRAEYRGNERINIPYPGLEIFKNEIRYTRDFHFAIKETNT